METPESNLWQQLSPEQRARIVALLVRMLLQQLSQQTGARHDPA
jgi:hypothetical protein